MPVQSFDARAISLEKLDGMMASKEEMGMLIKGDHELSQLVVDTLGPHATELSNMQRRRAMYLIPRLCKKHKILPSDAFIREEITNVSARPLFRSGSSDVYSGCLMDCPVLIRRPRIYSGDPHSEEATRTIYAEVARWRCLKHRNVFPLLGVSDSVFSESISIVTLRLESGNILGFLKGHPNADRVKLLRDIVSGLEHLHTFNVVHGNLKPTYILITDEGTAVIADSIRAMDSGETMAFQGTELPIYLAPEIFEGEPYTKQSDTYAFGMIAWRLFTDIVPYPCASVSMHVVRRVIEGERPPRPENGEVQMPDHLWALIQRCWDSSPPLRPNVSDILPQLENT